MRREGRRLEKGGMEAQRAGRLGLGGPEAVGGRA
jgi:hypothetical protein